MTTRSDEVRDAREGDGITIDQEDEGKMTRPNDKDKAMHGIRKSWTGWVACLLGRHEWQQSPHYHYILNDSGFKFYECARCGRSRTLR